MSFSKVWLTLTILSPLVYSGPGYLRFPAALIIAAASSILLFQRGFRPRVAEISFVALYVLALLFQPIFIAEVWLTLALGQAIYMVAMLFPAWALYSTHGRLKSLEAAAFWSVDLLFVLTIALIYTSYVLGVGEVVTAGEGVNRAFSWLGDRYTPVIVFLVLFFGLERQLLHVLALVVALWMTGGKSAAVLLGVAPLVYAVIAPMSVTKRLFLFGGVALAASAAYANWDWLSSSVYPGADIAFSSRMLANHVGLIYFLENPWLGVGIDRSIYESVDLAESIIQASGAEAYTMPRIHNAFIRTAAELGVVGLIALLGLCYMWVMRCKRILAHAYSWPRSQARSFVIAGTLWAICFILFYQTVDWFMGGENQLAWLLMIIASAEAIFRRAQWVKHMEPTSKTRLHQSVNAPSAATQ